MTVGADSLVFGGAPGVTPPPAALPPDVRHLRIEIGPRSFRPGLRYQTRIDPLDADWSHPTADPFAEMTRLPPGDYTFRARTIGPNGEVGPETAWPFRVRPPWYLTHWALALWMLAAVLLVIGYSWLRSSLRRQDGRPEPGRGGRGGRGARAGLKPYPGYTTTRRYGSSPLLVEVRP